MKRALLFFGLLLSICATASAAGYPAPAEGDFVIENFRFESGETLPRLSLHYATLGTPRRDADGGVVNAVLVLHGTGGSGRQFLTDAFAGALFGPGQLLDATRYFVILPDAIGAGRSSKPSDGLRARFPRYCYHDMIEAQHRLLTDGLRVHHLRLVIGTSMGGMHAWLWGESHPEFADALLPLACLPAEIAGRNRMFRRMIVDSIRNDPEWKGGDYARQPRGLVSAIHVLLVMVSAPLAWQNEYPTREAADRFLEDQVRSRVAATDANDMLYQFEASRDYDPAPNLAAIRAPLLAINFADDQVNPPELAILERAIAKVPRGRAIVMPITEKTRGHRTHSLPEVWKAHLAAFLAETETGAPATRGAAAAGAPREAPGADAAAVEALERELVGAIGRRDLATYDRLVADDYAASGVDGKTVTKAEVVASYRSGARGYRDLSIYDVSARVHGDTAVVTARTKGFRVEDGKETENRVRYVRVYARRNGEWRAVSQFAARE